MILRRASRRAAVFGVTLLGALAFAEKPAHAYEHQFHLGGAFGYSDLVNNGSGLGGRINLDYGVSDAINLMSRVEFTGYPSPGLMLPSVAFGVGYVIDIPKFVPYFGAMAGFGDIWFPNAKCAPAGSSSGTPCNSAKLLLEVPVGIDYVVSYRVTVGIVGRYQLLVVGSAANQIGGFLKAEYTWGY